MFLKLSSNIVRKLSPNIAKYRHLSPSGNRDFKSLVSTIWFDCLAKFSFVGYSLHIEIIVEILFRFSQKLNTKISLSFIGKEISGTIISPIFIKKTSPRHNRFSELFTHEGRLVTSNMFFLYRGMNIEDFRGNVFKFFKFSRQNIFQR